MPKYKCTKKCFAARLYEQGEIVTADKAPGEFFVEIGSQSADKGGKGSKSNGQSADKGEDK